MTTLFDQAVETVRSLPAERQDEIARLLLEIAGEDNASVVQLTPDEEMSLDESMAQAARGEFATDEEIRAIWAKHGL
jgi:predicted transcriptional regulator